MSDHGGASVPTNHPPHGSDATRPADMRSIQASTSTSDLEIARKGALIALARIHWLESRLQKMTKRAATAEAILISQTAAQRAPRKIVNRTGDGPNYTPDIPQDIVKEGQAIHRSAHRTARVFFTFFSTYSPQHIWNKVPENLFEWNNPVKRWDPVFPLNVKIAHAYELRKATDHLGLEWIKRETPAYKQEFEASVADTRSEAIKRARDHGPDIFGDFKDEIDSAFATLRAHGGTPLTYTRKKQEPIPLTSFSNALFLSESAGARKSIPGLDSIIGIWEQSSGVFESNPINARLIYKNYKVKSGEEFESEALFRLCRCVLYGPTSIMKKAGLALNSKSPLSRFKLMVTPGLIIGTITIARLALSFDGIFAGDGGGPTTKIQYDNNADDLLEALMKIWETPRGKAIREVWTQNIFPSQVTHSTTRHSSQNVPATPIRRRAATEMAAREATPNRAQARKTPAPSRPATGLVQQVQQDNSHGNVNNGGQIDYNNDGDNIDMGSNAGEDEYGDLITQSFFQPAGNLGYEDKDKEEGNERNSDILGPMKGHQSSGQEKEEDDEDDEDDEGYSPFFDEEAGEVLDGQRPPVARVGGLDFGVELALVASSTPQHKWGIKSPAATANLRGMPAPHFSSQPLPTGSTTPLPTASPPVDLAPATTKPAPKPRRRLNQQEREEPAVAAADLGDLGTGNVRSSSGQDQHATRRSTRSTGTTVSLATATMSGPTLDSSSQQVPAGGSAEATSSSIQAAPKRSRGGRLAGTGGRGSGGRGVKAKKGGI